MRVEAQGQRGTASDRRFRRRSMSQSLRLVSIPEPVGCNYSVHALSCRFVVRGLCRPGRRGCRRVNNCRGSRGQFAEPSLSVSTQPLDRYAAPAALKARQAQTDRGPSVVRPASFEPGELAGHRRNSIDAPQKVRLPCRTLCHTAAERRRRAPKSAPNGGYPCAEDVDIRVDVRRRVGDRQRRPAPPTEVPDASVGHEDTLGVLEAGDVGRASLYGVVRDHRCRRVTRPACRVARQSRGDRHQRSQPRSRRTAGPRARRSVGMPLV